MALVELLMKNAVISMTAIHKIQEKSFHQVLDEMTSNIRIMGNVSDFLGFNDGFISALRWNSKNQREAIEAIEAYLAENDVDYEPFDPEATGD